MNLSKNSYLSNEMNFRFDGSLCSGPSELIFYLSQVIVIQ